MYISKIVNYENMQRCLSIGRRTAQPALVTAGVLLSTYELLKQTLMQSGKLEEALSKVTSSKIGIHEGTVNSREQLLKRLKRYRMLFGIVMTVRESNMLARLEHAIEDMETDVSTGALRKQPFCVVLYGPPGVGKSSFAIQLAKKLMQGRYGRFTSHDMVTLNETDEYQSEFRTSHKVVLFDDIGAAKVDRPDTTNPWRKVIDFVNNVQKTALNPNCEMKGKVYIQPDLVILTTNIDFSKSFANVSNYVNCPEAIARRCSSVIQLKDFNSGVIITYDIMKDHLADFCGKMPGRMYPNGGEVISREAIVEQLDEQFRKHMLDQQIFIDRFNGYFDDLSTIDEEFDCQAEIYEPQASIAPKYDPLHEERLTNYLISHIDWDYYFCAYPYGHNQEIYYFDGYIYECYVKYPAQAIRVSSDYMNELRQKMLDITPDPYKHEELCMDIPDLVAESDTCVVSDNLSGAFVDDKFTLELSAWDEDLSLSQYYVPHGSYLHNPLKWMATYTYSSMGDYSRLRGLLNSQSATLSKHAMKKLKESGSTKVGSTLLIRFLLCLGYSSSDDPIERQKAICFLLNCPSFRIPYHIREKYHLTLSKLDSDFLNVSYDSLVSSLSKSLINQPRSSALSDREFDDFISSSSQSSRDSASEQSLSIDSGSSGSRPSLSESGQIDEFLRILHIPTKHISKVCKNLQLDCFGEIDVILKVDDFIIVAELKRSHTALLKVKARQQAKKYASVISLLQPETRVFGISYTYRGMEIVFDNGIPFKSNVCDDLFKILGYTKQHLV